MITYSEADINRKLAEQAHQGTSFTPERRADSVIQSYIQEMAGLVEEFSSYVTTDNEAEIKKALEAYRKGYIFHLNAFLSAHTRVMSTMITGPANFPTARNEKRWRTADKRREEWLTWCKKEQDKMHRRFNPVILANAPISADDSEAVTKLQAKIEAAEKLQETMKAANAIIRKKGLTQEQKIADLVGLDLDQIEAAQLLVPNYMGGIGFEHFQLTNNNANIRRMKERVEQLKKERSKAPAGDTVINGVTVSENTGLNRLQLFFPGKPSVEVRDRLKSRGFHWSPRECAWQRQLNDSARQAARQVLEGLK